MVNPPVVAAGLIALMACGRVGFEPGTQQNDDVADAAAIIPDAGCVRGPFGPPVRLTQVSTDRDEMGPWISDDGLEIIFSSARTGTVDLYRSRRTTLSDPFDSPSLALTDNSPDLAEDNPELSSDNLTIWFDRDRLMRKATRPDRFSPFEMDTSGALTSSDSEFAIGLSSDGLRLLYTTDRDGSVLLKLNLATRASTADQFPLGTEQTALNVSDFTCCATFSPDSQSIIYTSSNPFPLHLAIAQFDGNQYANPVDVDTMRPAGVDEFDAYWSRNGKYLIFGSNRDTLADTDLYLMTAECL